MARIFISYRRGDSAGHAGRLFDRLRGRYGDDRVFMDVTGIEAGVDFVDAIDAAVGSCDVLLAVIGPDWLGKATAEGRRRLDDANDFVRVEIGSALKRNVRVIPVLVDDAVMPSADILPDDIKRLARRQAVELRDKRWDADVEALISVVQKVLVTGDGDVKPVSAATTPTPATSTPLGFGLEAKSMPRRSLLWIAALVGVFAAAALAVLGIELVGKQPDGEAPVAAAPSPGPGKLTPPQAPTETPAARIPTARERTPPAAPATPTQVPRQRAAESRASSPTPSSGASGSATHSPETPSVRPSIPAAAADRAPARVPRRLIVVAWGQTSFRSFWDHEQPETYTLKMLSQVSELVHDAAGKGVIQRNPDRGLTRRVLQGKDSGREGETPCAGNPDGLLIAAYLADSIAISSIESAYWPDLRLGILDCAKGAFVAGSFRLSPEVGDAFPFANSMKTATRRFLAENRNLID